MWVVTAKIYVGSAAAFMFRIRFFSSKVCASTATVLNTLVGIK